MAYKDRVLSLLTSDDRELRQMGLIMVEAMPSHIKLIDRCIIYFHTMEDPMERYGRTWREYDDEDQYMRKAYSLIVNNHKQNWHTVDKILSEFTEKTPARAFDYVKDIENHYRRSKKLGQSLELEYRSTIVYNKIKEDKYGDYKTRRQK